MFREPNDLSRALYRLPVANQEWRSKARARQETLTKPPGSLGRLEDLAVFLAGWSKDGSPSCRRVQIVVFAGSHGVAAQNVSAYPPEVTAQMVQNFQDGGAAINALARGLDAQLSIIPLNVEKPTADISQEAALTEAEALDAINTGAEAVKPATDILVVGEMGISNSTIAAALATAAFGGRGVDWVGPGTGVDADIVARKANIVDTARARLNTSNPSAFETLRQLGGRETAAIAGAIIAARMHQIPVVLDGFITTAAVAPLYAEAPGIVAHVIAGHVSAEPAHRRLLQNMNLKPLLDLGLRLGEGSGAALAVSILRAAVATHCEMATFRDAGVSSRAAT